MYTPNISADVDVLLIDADKDHATLDNIMGSNELEEYYRFSYGCLEGLGICETFQAGNSWAWQEIVGVGLMVKQVVNYLILFKAKHE